MIEETKRKSLRLVRALSIHLKRRRKVFYDNKNMKEKDNREIDRKKEREEKREGERERGKERKKEKKRGR